MLQVSPTSYLHKLININCQDAFKDENISFQTSSPSFYKRSTILAHEIEINQGSLELGHKDFKDFD
jgi:hypothetical protein